MKSNRRPCALSSFSVAAWMVVWSMGGWGCSGPVGALTPTIDAAGGSRAPDAAMVAGECISCESAADCPGNGVCVQFDNSDYCAAECSGEIACSASETCTLAVTQNGEQVSACIPASGTCSGTGCGVCPAATTCSILTGVCEPNGSTIDAGTGTTSCNGEAPPGASSCCTSCTAGSSGCQANGCYGGWYCNSASCNCQSPPSSCGGPPDAGTHGMPDAGTHGAPDAAPTFGPDAGIVTGNIGPNGGSVPLLYFAVVGDTRPPNEDDTAHYPTAIITKIYQDIEAMNPRPQFIVSTGDYQYANPSGTQSGPQIQAYMTARSQYTGTSFATMGNHECTGYTDSNCTGSAGTASNNFQTFMTQMVKPLGQSVPYYTIPFSDTNGQWAAKLIVTACNDWDSTQQSWLATQLAKSTTYTFNARHEAPGTTAPCSPTMDSMMSSATYDLFIVGHSHTYSHSGKQLIEGVGGAPITGSANYGYATVQQKASGGFTVTQYDYSTAAAVNTFTVP